MVHPPAFVWPDAIAYWVAHVWAFLPEIRLAREGLRDAGAEDRDSLRLIVVSTQIAYLAALGLALQPWGAMSSERLPLAAAIVLLATGGILRRTCFRALGPDFTGAVRTRPGQRVVASGPYRRVRHPSYGAALLMLTGCGVALGNWASALLVATTSVLVYLQRARVEEEALLAAMGEAYRVYAAVTPRFLPRPSAWAAWALRGGQPKRPVM